jgi:hypothetical protein
MTLGARWILVLGVVAAAIALSAGPRVSSARAAGAQESDLATTISDYANAQVDTGMAEADAVVAEAVQGAAAPSAPEASPPQPQPPASPAPSPVDPPAPVVVGTVEVPAVATEQPTTQVTIVIPPGIVDSPGASRPRHALETMTPRPKSTVQTKAKVVSRAKILRVDVRTSTSASWSSSSTSARSVAESSVRSSVRSSTSGGRRSERPATPKVPLPFPPFPPNAPAPNSGASQSGGSGGQGALLIFFVALAALVLFGIHRLLRKVHWSNLRMPRRGAVLPWRPG